LFRALLDEAKGHPITSLPGWYPARNRLVRAKFDALEQEFEEEITEVVRQALAAKQSASAALIMDEFSERCVHKVLTALQELMAKFTTNSRAKLIN
jgi:hypothetical protein